MKLKERVNGHIVAMLSTLSVEKLMEICETSSKSVEDWKKLGTQIKNYNLQIKNDVVECEYVYAKGLDYGRLFCSKSVQGLPKDIRGLLMKHTTDVDMKNAHPTILLYLAKKHNIQCDNLQMYINNRDEILSQFDISKDDAKTLFLQSINKEDFTRNINNEFFNKFDKEVKTIMSEICSHDEYSKMIDSIPSSKTYNRLGSGLNRILCYYENNILQVVIKFLQKKKITISTLMFDGLMIEGNYYHDKQLLIDIQKAVEKEFPGLNMKFDYKPHSNLIKIEQLFTTKIMTKQLTEDVYKNGDIILKSGMGTHKTQSLLKYCQTLYKDVRMLFTSNKINQAFDLEQKLRGVFNQDNIWNYKTKQQKKGNIHIVQPESMNKVMNQRPYDVVVIDEIVSVLEAFCSPTQKDRAICNLHWLKHFLEKSEQIIAMDADVDEFHKSILERMTGREIPLITNIYKNTTKKHLMVKKPVEFFKAIKDGIDKGWKMVFPVASVSMADKIKRFIQLNVPNPKILCYTSNEDDKSEDFVNGVNNVWIDYDYLIYTSKVPNGISFDVKHFDACYSYLSNKSVSARELAQMENRVRNLKQNLVICYAKSGNGSLPTDVSEIKREFETKYREQVLFLKNNIDEDVSTLSLLTQRANGLLTFEKEVSIIRDLFFHKKAEMNRTRNNPSTEYMRYTIEKQGRSCDYTNEFQDEEFAKTFVKTSAIIKKDLSTKIIDDWRATQVQDVEKCKERVQQGLATKEDKLIIEKDILQSLQLKIDETNILQVKKHKQKIFNRVKLEKRRVSSEKMKKEVEDLFYYDVNYKNNVQREAEVKTMISMLKPVMTEQEITALSFNFDKLFTLFDIEKPKRNKNQDNDAIWMKDRLNSILHEYCYDVKSTRKGKGDKMYYLFEFGNLKIYNDIL